MKALSRVELVRAEKAWAHGTGRRRKGWCVAGYGGRRRQGVNADVDPDSRWFPKARPGPHMYVTLLVTGQALTPRRSCKWVYLGFRCFLPLTFDYPSSTLTSAMDHHLSSSLTGDNLCD